MPYFTVNRRLSVFCLFVCLFVCCFVGVFLFVCSLLFLSQSVGCFGGGGVPVGVVLVRIDTVLLLFTDIPDIDVLNIV